MRIRLCLMVLIVLQSLSGSITTSFALEDIMLRIRVVDPDSKRLNNARVQVIARFAPNQDRFPATASSDGLYTVAIPQRFYFESPMSIDVVAAGFKPVQVPLQPGAERPEITITIAPAIAVSQQQAGLEKHPAELESEIRDDYNGSEHALTRERLQDWLHQADYEALARMTQLPLTYVYGEKEETLQTQAEALELFRTFLEEYARLSQEKYSELFDYKDVAIVKSSDPAVFHVQIGVMELDFEKKDGQLLITAIHFGI